MASFRRALWLSLNQESLGFLGCITGLCCEPPSSFRSAAASTSLTARYLKWCNYRGYPPSETPWETRWNSTWSLRIQQPLASYGTSFPQSSTKSERFHGYLATFLWMKSRRPPPFAVSPYPVGQPAALQAIRSRVEGFQNCSWHDREMEPAPLLMRIAAQEVPLQVRLSTPHKGDVKVTWTWHLCMHSALSVLFSIVVWFCVWNDFDVHYHPRQQRIWRGSPDGICTL